MKNSIKGGQILSLLGAVSLIMTGCSVSNADKGIQSSPMTSVQLSKNSKISENSNWAVKKFRDTISLACSSNYKGWSPRNVVDENLQSSWFSDYGDSAALKKHPWIELTFPQDIDVSRVTAMGNQDFIWGTGFSVTKGNFQLFDADGKLLQDKIQLCSGESKNIDVRFDKSIKNVRRIRFNSIEDEGKVNKFGDVAIAELQVE